MRAVVDAGRRDGTLMVRRRPADWHGAGQKVLQGLWFGVIPALLAALVLRFLIPSAVSGVEGAVAWIGDRYMLWLGVVVFFVFSMAARYWRFHLPGGRYASPLPVTWVTDEKDPERLAEWATYAALDARVGSRAMGGHLARTLGPALLATLDARQSDLHGALERGDLDSARVAARAVEEIAATALASRRSRELIAVVAAAFASFGLAFVLHARVVAPYRVLSASMLPTLEPADYVAGNHLAYRSLFGGAGKDGGTPRRGDVIVFRSSAVPLAGRALPDALVKRVIGIPGDRISMHGDVPVINGWEVPYCEAGKYVYIAPGGEMLRGRVRVEFIEDRDYLTLQSLWLPFPGPYVVQPGEVFVLGDNRSNSLDSRAWDGGRGAGVPFDAIMARAQWFLLGNRLSGIADWSRLLRSIDTLDRTVHDEGLDVTGLAEGVARCLRSRPAATRPPEPSETSALSSRAP